MKTKQVEIATNLYATRWYFVSEYNQFEYEQYKGKLVYKNNDWLQSFCKCRKIGTYLVILSNKTEQKFYFNGVKFGYIKNSNRVRIQSVKQLSKKFNLSEKEYFILSNIPVKFISRVQLIAICKYMEIIRPKICSNRYFSNAEKYLCNYYNSIHFYTAYYNYYDFIGF